MTQACAARRSVRARDGGPRHALRLAAELLIFAAATLALADAGKSGLAVAFAVIVLAHIVLMYELGAYRRERQP